MRFWIEQSKLFNSEKRSANKRLLASVCAISLGLALALAPGLTSAADQTSKLVRVMPSMPIKVYATSVLATLKVKGRAPKTGYARSMFSDGWADIATCSAGGSVDTRNYILMRDLKNKTYKTGCTVASGVLRDPYTGTVINFVRGVKTSLAVQIDHVVPLSDAWQKGAQQIGAQARFNLFNDPNNLIAVDGPTNGAKSDSDAASWLPPNKAYRCQYVARQIFVKAKYHLWVTAAERDAMKNVLSNCPRQLMPTAQKTANLVAQR